MGVTVGLPPIMNFGSNYLKEKVNPLLQLFYTYSLLLKFIKVVRPCLSGDKVISLVITEPTAGSDVANIKTEVCYFVVLRSQCNFLARRS